MDQRVTMAQLGTCRRLQYFIGRFGFGYFSIGLCVAAAGLLEPNLGSSLGVDVGVVLIDDRLDLKHWQCGRVAENGKDGDENATY